MPNGGRPRNGLLRAMNADDLALVRAQLEPVACPRSMVLTEPDEPLRYVYFPEDGIASMVARSPRGSAAEVGVVGREGMVSSAVALGVDRIPHVTEMQIAGSALRIERTALVALMERSASLRAVLLRFAHVNSVQGAHTALANAVHPVDERLARWLLMCHDRSDSDDLALTHDYLAVMLAVRRPSVTGALHVLEGDGLITAERGHVTIRNRAALEAFAADAYGRPEAEYRRLIGPLR